MPAVKVLGIEIPEMEDFNLVLRAYDKYLNRPNRIEGCSGGTIVAWIDEKGRQGGDPQVVALLREIEHRYTFKKVLWEPEEMGVEARVVEYD